MMLWEFVLKADRERDLADPDRGQAWFWEVDGSNALRWPVRKRPPGEAPPPQWPAPLRQTWAESIHTLRAVAGHLKKAKTRPAGKLPEGRDLFRDYLKRLRLDCDPWGLARPLPSNTPGLTVEEFMKPEVAAAEAVSVFFQAVFASLVTLVPAALPVCGRCMRPLGPTPTGRTSRAEFCPSCKFAAWNAKRPARQRRERWAADQREHRAKEKPTNPTTKKGK